MNAYKCCDEACWICCEDRIKEIMYEIDIDKYLFIEDFVDTVHEVVNENNPSIKKELDVNSFASHYWDDYWYNKKADELAGETIELYGETYTI